MSLLLSRMGLFRSLGRNLGWGLLGLRLLFALGWLTLLLLGWLWSIMVDIVIIILWMVQARIHDWTAQTIVVGLGVVIISIIAMLWMRRPMIFLLIYVLLQGSFSIFKWMICLWISILVVEVKRIRLNFLSILQVSCLLILHILIEQVPIHLMVLLLSCCHGSQ